MDYNNPSIRYDDSNVVYDKGAVELGLNEVVIHRESLAKRVEIVFSEIVEWTEEVKGGFVKIINEISEHTEVFSRKISKQLQDVAQYTERLEAIVGFTLVETVIYTETLIKSVAKYINEIFKWSDTISHTIVEKMKSAISTLKEYVGITFKSFRNRKEDLNSEYYQYDHPTLMYDEAGVHYNNYIEDEAPFIEEKEEEKPRIQKL